MKTKILSIVVLALALTVNAQTNVSITLPNGATIPLPPNLISPTDLSNLEATAIAVESATNGLSFTNTSLYIGSGYESLDGSGGASDAYFSVDYRLYNSDAVGISLGVSGVLNSGGTGLHDADVRINAIKDLSNFQVYGGVLFGRELDVDVGFYAGVDAGVRYNLSAAMANTSNPILNFLAGSGKVHTYVETEFDAQVPLAGISTGIAIQKAWRIGVGVAF